MIIEKLDDLIKQSLKDKKAIETHTYRLLKARLQNLSKQVGVIYSDIVEITAIQKLIKECEESLVYFGEFETVMHKQTREEIEILKTFLPQMMDKKEVKEYMEAIPNYENMKVNDIKKLMFKELRGKADSSLINEVIKDYIANDKA